jgi:tyrosyl-tRNA synthetase
LPSFKVSTDDISKGIGILDAFVRAGLASSNTAVRNQIANTSIMINNTKIDDPRYVISQKDIDADGYIKLSYSKKSHALIKISDEDSNS